MYFRITGILLISILCFKCGPPRTALQQEARAYQKGKLKEDTSFVYQLPYEHGTKHRVIQGYYSKYTHKYRAALDFKMKVGTPICAARDGIVMRTKNDSNKGGFKKKYRPDANFVVIDHADSIRTSYRHLQFNCVTVQAGDTVHQGQIIGRSGKTGYTFTPHLHFIVTKYIDGQWQGIPSRFETKSFKGYLTPLRRYESINNPPGK
ncbi:MAG: M23 family metallopeptidase [Saprospiraceae bacterium]